jgi:hypothetical protein
MRSVITYTLYKILMLSTSYENSMMRWTGRVARMQKKRKPYRLSEGKPTGKRPLERPSNIWEDNIIMDLGEKGRDGMGCRSVRKEETEKGKIRHNVERKPKNTARFIFHVAK